MDPQYPAHHLMDAGHESTAWIETYTGRKFHFLKPTPEMVDWEDVAHATSMLCRYAGHVQRFYSVAEHQVLIADWLFRQHGDPELALEGLIHDGSEGYLVDVPRPIKPHLLGYHGIESRIQCVINFKAGLRFPMSDRVKEADARILVDEKAQAMNQTAQNRWASDGLEPLGVELRFLPPDQARDEWKFAFEEYMGLTVIKRGLRASKA